MAFSSKSTETLPDLNLVPDWLNEAGLTPKRYLEELEAFRTEAEDFRDIFFQIFNIIGECPETKNLRAEYNALLRSFSLRTREPIAVGLELMRILERAITFQHTRTKKKIPRVAQAIDEEDAEELEEILPKNGRAMVLLRSLKDNPTRAIDSVRATSLLEGQEGRVPTRAMVLRAMGILAETYPSVIFDKIGKKKRILIKSSSKSDVSE